MSILSSIWFLAVPLLSEPSGEAALIPWWLWLILALFIIGLPILTIAFGPGLRQKAVAAASAPPGETAHAPAHAHPAPEPVAPAKQDDLTRIEGIGPKIARTLVDAGITTYDALGTTTVAELQAILDQDPNLRLAVPTSWPQQAILAAAGDWDELDKLQAELRGGRTIG
jgi:predicted flap endonuclease-1-like 5' DNA nuclease